MWRGRIQYICLSLKCVLIVNKTDALALDLAKQNLGELCKILLTGHSCSTSTASCFCLLWIFTAPGWEPDQSHKSQWNLFISCFAATWILRLLLVVAL